MCHVFRHSSLLQQKILSPNCQTANLGPCGTQVQEYSRTQWDGGRNRGVDGPRCNFFIFFFALNQDNRALAMRMNKQSSVFVFDLKVGKMTERDGDGG